MSLPMPNLDDRRFQDLVDEAKRHVQRRAPEWTDHNVSDPGVTLIETFAHMVDQLVYRLNRVPEKNYLAFLELLGIRLFPPAAARADVTFWLSAAQPEVVLLPRGTEVATARSETGDAVVFATTEELPIVPCELTALVTISASGEQANRTDDLDANKDVPCFQPEPAVGDAMLLGLSNAVPRCVVVLRLDSQVEGIGVDPRQPPLVWESWDGVGWAECQVFDDTTGGLNRPGEVVVHVPAGHAPSVVAGARAGWLRCRVVAPEDGQPFYSESPTVRVAEAFTIGGITAVEHAETVTDAPLGVSAGVAGQRFRLDRAPVLTDGEPVVVQVADGEGWEDWHVVEHFGDSGPTDRHVTLDPTNGEFGFPPAVRAADGTLRRYGAVPARGAQLRVPSYRTGGGRAGNVARGAISVLRSSVPYITDVENREAAAGGVDGETVDEAKVRAPHQLRVQERAVTAEDYELIARQAAPAAARIHCLPAGARNEPGAARVLVVPDAVADVGDRIRFEQLIPAEQMLAAIAARLDERRLLGTRLIVEPPFYQGITVVARMRAGRSDPTRVRRGTLDALYGYLNPLRGGIDGTGWPFGRPVQLGEVYAVLQRVEGVELIDEVRMFPADPITGQRGAPVDRVELAAHALVFSHQHQVLVQPDGAAEGGAPR
ncbi:putative baseplate assembly protein [Saccharopolyspora antimicrobica]|uniref:Phage baseplate assembly protein n=1 Tax=Saccharopolyspora antimicrobica TaxID=455193 RepID=A0A1I4U4D5_9PSEU|nr:putative baseplate assembly protein [Saccharopolyspora antimicrobica]RKT88680.1 putative phage baseplate assembly protein [Saccharopolyspora antimicrobica]SFM83868.1 putative baseplate assembly protein [Saccharopolyspora antimicrobica]